MESIQRTWWVLAVRGLVGILVGILFFIWPLPSLGTLVLLFGAWALLDGSAAFTCAIADRCGVHSVVEGIFGVAIAVLTFWQPILTAYALSSVIAAWAVVIGLFRVIGAVRLRHMIPSEVWLGLSGLTSVLLGITLATLPVSGVLSLGWLIGSFAIAIGAMLLGLALRLRRTASSTVSLRVS
ncbi:membrane protein [Sorangium cellulosum]|uniref:Membrane protein n=1 Tax=Sorangium cellulosum TaxID=56 RepID=A0A4P2QC42_SORCE|nr:DUF308 domain-containing protein [Sorangium cellulosum]AUX27300.1 membrane protein [Sorangium cellulosum]